MWSSFLPFKAHVYNTFIFESAFQNFWATIQNLFTCLFSYENEQYFSVNGNVAIHFHIAFCINCQSDLTLICAWSKIHEQALVVLF